jgi:YD repeat-containing protein
VVTDPNNHQTTYTFDAQGRVTQTKDAKGNTTSNAYTSNYNVQTYTDAASKIVTFSWSTDGKNNLLSAQSPTGQTTSWQYTDANHPYFPSTTADA